MTTHPPAYAELRTVVSHGRDGECIATLSPQLRYQIRLRGG